MAAKTPQDLAKLTSAQLVALLDDLDRERQKIRAEALVVKAALKARLEHESAVDKLSKFTPAELKVLKGLTAAANAADAGVVVAR